MKKSKKAFDRMKIVIVGGGICAVYIANKLLKKRKNLDIQILSLESYKPYDRIHLCSLVNQSLGIEDIELALESKVKLELNQEVTDIYTKSKVVITKTASFEYDKLIIATGSKPKTLFNIHNLDNATAFRDIADSQKIAKGIVDRNVVLVGVGAICLELLDIISKMNTSASIHILSRGEYLYSKDLDIALIKQIQNTFESNQKVKFSFKDEIVSTQIENNHIVKVVTKTQEIDNPFVIFGVGITPNIHFAKGSLEIDEGILVNNSMQTSENDIYAVGEAAQIKEDGFIARRVKECVNQCDVAVASLLNLNQEFEHKVAIDSLKVGAFLLADVTSKKYDMNDIDNEKIIMTSKKDHRVDQYIINNNKLMRFIGINTNIDVMYLKKMIRNNENIDASYLYDNRLVSEKGRLVCSCKPTHELDLVEIIQENCIENFNALAPFTKAGRVCGRCKQDIVKIIENTPIDPKLALKIKEEKRVKKEQEALQKVQKRLEKFNKFHPQNQLDASNFESAIKSYDMSQEYNQMVSMITAKLKLHPQYESSVNKALKNLNKLPIIWIELSDCTGNSESFIKSAHPTIEELILDFISLDYHELLMAPSGEQSESVLSQLIEKEKGKYILLVEGAVPLGLDGKFLRIGEKAETGIELLKRCAKDAALVVAVGTCAYDGGVVASGSNPTQAVGVREALKREDIINLPGCPTNPINIVGTLLHYVMFAELPSLDEQNRPTFAYGYRIHDNCERRGHYDLGEFVQEWGDEGAKKGWCLFNMGCKGPYSNLNCSLVKFNEGTSWPVACGHGCFACGEGKIAFDEYANNRVLKDANSHEKK
ncbi:MAG: hydrogenase small subunit [Candidatus Marinarcus sp.]|uniref:hydrogenase small subunit n=1 Tax=Candidatus Marinarcus sp. TaxID=3100987 RepID=UPI003AFF977B